MALDGLADETPLLALMAGYHLGQSDHLGSETSEKQRQSVQGKRIRPMLALQCCAAAGGDPATAAPLAAAIELLHNFTLIHDDIQDRSPNRRHRATVWRIWGDAQAINAGDALFAAAQRTLLRTSTDTVPATTLLRLADEFNRMTIEIVRGQVLDLAFETESSVTPDAYLDMIRAKTGAIVRFAAWAGAIVGGASDELAGQFAEFGDMLGIGFQIQDDLLGIWGAMSDTGKDPADDIRRHKKSLPVLMLIESATPEETAMLKEVDGRETVSGEDVERVLAAMDAHNIRAQVTERVREAHRRAESALANIGHAAGEVDSNLTALIRRLDARIS